MIICEALMMTMMISGLGKHIQKHTHAKHTRTHTHAPLARMHASVHTHTNTINVSKQQTHHKDIAICLNIYSVKCLTFYSLKFENVY